MSAAWCRYHPEQTARGVCVHCAAALCSACITKIDGVNHCHACLAARAHHEVEQASRAPGPPAPLRSWLEVGLGLGLLSTLSWLLLSQLLPPPGAP